MIAGAILGEMAAALVVGIGKAAMYGVPPGAVRQLIVGLLLRRPTGSHDGTMDRVEDGTTHEDMAIWTRRDATLNDKSALQEFGLTQAETCTAMAVEV